MLHARREPTWLDRIPGSDAYLELVRMFRDPRRFLHERFEAHGHIFKTRLVYPVVYMVGTEANHTIMVTRRHDFSYELGYGQLALSKVFAKSIMLMDGDEHKRTREILTPAVGRLAIRDSADRVRDIWVRSLANAADGQTHDAYTVAQRTTFDVAANALTGLQFGAELDEFRPYFERLIDGTVAVSPLRVPFGTLDRSLKSRAKLLDMLRPRVERARRDPPEGLIGALAHYRDETGQPLAADEVSAHVMMLFWAAYDTTASAASWILHVLAERPDWQQRLRNESRARLGDQHLDAENQRELEQLGWFLREAERMYPSVLFFPRITVEDIEFRGYEIPSGTSTYYSPYLSHRDPTTFEHPNAFDPDRWNPQRPGGPPKSSALIGFGGGPRVCLGKAFAQLQLRIMVDELLRRYRVEPDPTCKPSILALPVHHPKDSRFRLRALDS